MINFPTSAKAGDIHRENGSIFRFNGFGWDATGIKSTEIQDESITHDLLATTNSGNTNQILARRGELLTWITPPVASVIDPALFSGFEAAATGGGVSIGPGYAFAYNSNILLTSIETLRLSSVPTGRWIWMVQDPGTGTLELAHSTSKTVIPSGYTIGRAVGFMSNSYFGSIGAGTQKRNTWVTTRTVTLTGSQSVTASVYVFPDGLNRSGSNSTTLPSNARNVSVSLSRGGVQGVDVNASYTLSGRTLTVRVSTDIGVNYQGGRGTCYATARATWVTGTRTISTDHSDDVDLSI